MPACLRLFQQTEWREEEMPPMVLRGVKSSMNQDTNVFFRVNRLSLCGHRDVLLKNETQTSKTCMRVCVWKTKRAESSGTLSMC